MAVEIPHLDKKVWFIIIGGAIVLGLYLRHRGASVSTDGTAPSDTLNGTDSLPDIGDAGDPYSTAGTASLAGGATGATGPPGARGPRGPKGRAGGAPPKRHKRPPARKPTRTIRHSLNHANGGPTVQKGHSG